ncbi:MAG TPA: tRNA (adenosine(37)-N6)-threonylcarbamoyltransferase complex dimerization subunit type 1 TsaB [Thermomicrobiales bacterium]|nr:tRNA (adenosine(37)-N6)-threonylcarbamoyltransferase complex dimerization subunit type 1 TsaB [Thermomicrobiales bacterium]
MTLNPTGWILGIDTSSDVASLALAPLADNEVFGAEIAWEAARNQTATLLAEIDHLCRLTGIESDDFAAVVIATGPGGFNALRVGMSVAKGFAFAVGIPIVGVGTLDIAARAVANWGLPVRAFVPAGRRRVVYADYRHNNGQLTRQGEIVNREATDLAADLLAPTVLTGDLSVAGERALRELPNVVLPGAGTRRRRASIMIDMALPRLLAGDADDLTTLEPLYLHQQRPEVAAGNVRSDSSS